MNTYYQKTLHYILTVFVFLSIIAVAGFGMYVGVEHSSELSMSHCLFHTYSGISSMKLGEHIESWRNSILGITVLWVSLFFLFFVFSFHFFSIHIARKTYVQIVRDIRGDPPKLFNFLFFLFSRGILHHKIF